MGRLRMRPANGMFSFDNRSTKNGSLAQASGSAADTTTNWAPRRLEQFVGPVGLLPKPPNVASSDCTKAEASEAFYGTEHRRQTLHRQADGARDDPPKPRPGASSRRHSRPSMKLPSRLGHREVERIAGRRVSKPPPGPTLSWPAADPLPIAMYSQRTGQ